MEQLIFILIVLGASAFKWWMERSKDKQPPPPPPQREAWGQDPDPFDELMEALGKKSYDTRPAPVQPPPPPPRPPAVTVPPPVVAQESVSLEEKVPAFADAEPLSAYQKALLAYAPRPAIADAPPAPSAIKPAASRPAPKTGTIGSLLRDPASLRRAVVMNEILMPPVSMRTA
jgi:hypothetical protein